MRCPLFPQANESAWAHQAPWVVYSPRLDVRRRDHLEHGRYRYIDMFGYTIQLCSIMCLVVWYLAVSMIFSSCINWHTDTHKVWYQIVRMQLYESRAVRVEECMFDSRVRLADGHIKGTRTQLLSHLGTPTHTCFNIPTHFWLCCKE